MLRAKSLPSCPTPWDHMDYSLTTGSSVHGILQARILESVAISFSRGSSQARGQTWVSCGSCISGRFFSTSSTWESQACIVVVCFLFFFLVLPLYCYQPISLHPRAHMLSHVTPWTAARQAPLSIDFSRQEYWSGLPFPSPRLYVFICCFSR